MARLITLYAMVRFHPLLPNNAGVAQLVERGPSKSDVESSNLFACSKQNNGLVVKLVNALDLKSNEETLAGSTPAGPTKQWTFD